MSAVGGSSRKYSVTLALLGVFALFILGVTLQHFSGSGISGFAILGDTPLYEDTLDKTYTGNTVYLWNPEQDVTLGGVALTGSVSGTGQATISLVDGTTSYLITSLSVAGSSLEFSQACGQSCDLPDLSSDKYFLRYEIEPGVTLNAGSIQYSTGPFGEETPENETAVNETEETPSSPQNETVTNETQEETPAEEPQLPDFSGGAGDTGLDEEPDFSGGAGTAVVSQNSCGTLNTDGETYEVTENLTDTDTCFTITGVGITLDCKGNNITYAEFSAGYGVDVQADNVTIHNCVIHQHASSAQSSSYGIYVNGANDTRITSSYVNTTDGTSYPLYLTLGERSVVYNTTVVTDSATYLADVASLGTVINASTFVAYTDSAFIVQITGDKIRALNNTIYSYAGGQSAFYLSGGYNSSFENNTIITNGSTSYGFYYNGGTYNSYTANNIINNTDVSSYPFFLYGDSDYHVIENNTVDQGYSGVSISPDTGGGNYPEHNNISKNTFAGHFDYGLEVTDSGAIFALIDQPIGNFSFSSSPQISFFDSQYGSVEYTTSAGTSGNNLSAIFEFGDRYVVGNMGLDTTFNSTANISLNNPGGEAITILHNDVLCSDTICSNQSPWSGEIVRFGISGWSNFSLQSAGDPFLLNSCQNISSSGVYNLSQEVSADGTCFNITASNVLLDGKGFTAYYGNETVGTGINISSAQELVNVTVHHLHLKKGTNGSGSSVGTENYGVYLERVANSTIYNNTILLDGFGEGAVIYFSSNTSSINVSSNVLNASSNSNQDDGIRLNGISHSIHYNTIFTNGSTLTDGIHMYEVNLTDFVNNTITTKSSTSQTHVGFRIENSSHNSFVSNNVSTNGTSGNVGFFITIDSDHNTFTLNSINTSGKPDSHAIRIDTDTGGTYFPEYNNFSQNILGYVDGSDLFIDDESINGSRFIDQIIRNYSITGSELLIFENTTFGTLTLFTNVTANGTNLIGQANSSIGFTNGTARINTSRDPGLNGSANISLSGLALDIPDMKYDLEDDGSFITCTAATDPACTNFSYAGGTLSFNVSHFTTFKVMEDDGVVELTDCQTITTGNTTYRLINNVSATSGTCFTIDTDNVTFLGDGYNIMGHGQGSAGIDAGETRQVTIIGVNVTKFNQGISFGLFSNDSVVRDSYVNTTSGHGIPFWNATNMTIINNTIDYVTGSDAGIYSDSGLSHTIENNTVRYSRTGIALYDTNNTLVRGNTVRDNLGTGEALWLRFQSFNNVIDSNTFIDVRTLVSLRGNASNTFVNNNFYTSSGVANHLITDLTGVSDINYFVYNNSFGEIRWTDNSSSGFLGNMDMEGNITFPGSIAISNNSIFVNASTVTSGLFNSTTNMTLHGLTFTNVAIEVDPEDDGSFVACSSNTDPACTVLDYNGSTLNFNTSHFTAYRAYEDDPFVITYCKDLDVDYGNYTLGANISSTGSCLTITADNVTLACNSNMISYGSTTNGKGIDVRGNRTYIEDCVVNQTGTALSGIGIQVRDAHNVTLQNNTVTTFGTTADAVVFIESQEGKVANNTIQTSTNLGALGIWLVNESNRALIVNNTITTNDHLAHGVVLDNATHATIINNSITTQNNQSYAVYVFTASDHTQVGFNTLETQGLTSTVVLTQTTQNATIFNNTVLSYGGSNGHGVYLFATNESTVFNNSITTNGTTAHGLRLAGDTVDNVLRENTLSVSGDAYRLELFSGDTPQGNNFTQNVVTSVTGTALTLLFVNESPTHFSDQLVGNYSINGSVLTLENSTFGAIQFFNPVNATGTALFGNSSAAMQISNNSIVINNTPAGLNESANLTLYGMDDFSFTNPEIKKEGSICHDCTNFTGLNASITLFNITGAGTYSIGEAPVVGQDTCGSLTEAGKHYNLTASVTGNGTCFEIGANNIILDCQGNNITYAVTGTGFAINNSADFDNITIQHCKINQGSTQSGSHAVYYAQSTLGTIVNNTITTYGDDAIPVHLDFFFAAATNNTVINNTLTTNGSTSSGILVDTSSHLNVLTDNTIFTSGPNGMGIDVQSADNVNVTGNVINTTGLYARAVRFTDANAAHVLNNTLSTISTNSAFCIDVVRDSDNTRITGNNLSSCGSHMLNFNSIASSYPEYTNFSQNSMGTSAFHDLNFADAAINETRVIDQIIRSYNFTGAGGTLHVHNSTYGVISFTSNISGTGTSLVGEQNSSLLFANGSILINTTPNTGLSASANLTLFNMDDFSFTTPAILRNGVNCADCTNFTALNASTTVFNITQGGLYSIGEQPELFPQVSAITPVDGQENGTFDLINVTFLSNQTDAAGLKNVSFFITNSTNESFTLSTYVNITGLFNETNFTQQLAIGNYTFGFETCDTGNQCNVTENRSMSIIFNSTLLVDACGSLSKEASYLLTQDVSGSGTCFTFNAHNASLDCQGNTITYKTGGSDLNYGVTTNSYDNVTVKNCNIVAGHSTSGEQGHSLVVTGTNGSMFDNNTLLARGERENTAILVSSSKHNTFVGNFLNTTDTTASSGNSDVFVFTSSSNNNVFNNTASGDGRPFYIKSSSHNNYFDGNIVLQTSSEFYDGVLIDPLISGNKFVNFNLSAVTNSDNMEDTSGTSTFNYLIFNNSFGEIAFTDSDLLKELDLDMSGIALGENIKIENNSAYVVSSTPLSKAANVTLHGIGDRGWPFPTIFRDGAVCDSCTNFTSLSADTVKFSVPNFSNYTLGDGSEVGRNLCGNLTSSGQYNLSTSVTSNGTCFTILANDVTLDCRGNTITWGTATGGHGVFSHLYNGTNIYNCNFEHVGSPSKIVRAIQYNRTNEGRIENVSIHIDTTAAADGILFGELENLTVQGTNITLENGSMGSVAIDHYWDTNNPETKDILFTGLNINTNMTTHGRAIALSYVYNVTINDTVINASGSDGDHDGLYFGDNMDALTILNTSVKTQSGEAGGESKGIYLGSGVKNVTIRALEIVNENDESALSTFQASQIHIENSSFIARNGSFANSGASFSSSHNITILNSSLTSGDCTGCGGVRLSGSSFVVLDNNRLYGGTDLFSGAISIESGGSEINISNNVLNSSGSEQLYIGGDGAGRLRLIDQILDNYTFRESGVLLSYENTSLGVIDFLEAIPHNGTHLAERISITNGTVFVNSSVPEWNVSANITLYNVTFAAVQMEYDLEDDGTFTSCSSGSDPSCTQLSYANEEFAFNVSHFTTFRLQDNDVFGPGILFVDPTNANNTNVTEGHFEVNVSIEDPNLKNVSYEFENINYTMYDDYLVLLLTLDNRSSLGENNTYVVDASSYAREVSISGNAQPNASGKFGGAFSFDGSGDALQVADFDDAGGNFSNITAMVWAKGTAQVGKVLFAHYDVNSNRRSWQMRTSEGSGDGFTTVLSGDGDTLFNMRIYNTVATPFDNTWHHFAFTWNGTNLTLYVDGQEAAVTKEQDDPLVSLYDTTANITLGANLNNEEPSSVFQGLLDQAMLFNRTLSADEINQFYMISLTKYNSTTWNLYVNQTESNSSTLSNGLYTYAAHAADTNNNSNSTEIRTVNVGGVIEITACGTYSNSRATFVLSQDFVPTTGNCLQFTGADIIVDGNGYTVLTDRIQVLTGSGTNGTLRDFDINSTGLNGGSGSMMIDLSGANWTVESSRFDYDPIDSSPLINVQADGFTARDNVFIVNGTPSGVEIFDLDSGTSYHHLENNSIATDVGNAMTSISPFNLLGITDSLFTENLVNLSFSDNTPFGFQYAGTNTRVNITHNTFIYAVDEVVRVLDNNGGTESQFRILNNSFFMNATGGSEPFAVDLDGNDHIIEDNFFEVNGTTASPSSNYALDVSGTNVTLKNNNFSWAANEITYGADTLLVYENNFGMVEWDFATASTLGTGGDFKLGTFLNITNATVNLDPNLFTTGSLNTSANITLYGVGDRGFAIPAILKNGEVCDDCHAFTSLSATTVEFNVTGFSNYTIGNNTDLNAVSSCQTITSSGTYQLTNNLSTTDVCLTITSSDVILECVGARILGNQSSVGINVTGANNVTIQNCGVHNHSTAVLWVQSNASTLQYNSFENNSGSNGAGTSISGSTGVQIIDSNYSRNSGTNGGSIYIASSSGIDMTGLTIRHTSGSDGSGVHFTSSNNMSFMNSSVFNATGSAFLRMKDENPAGKNNISYNFFNTTSGVIYSSNLYGNDDLFTYNDVQNSTSSVFYLVSNTEILNNSFVDINTTTDGALLYITGGGNNTFAHNNVTRIHANNKGAFFLSSGTSKNSIVRNQFSNMTGGQGSVVHITSSSNNLVADNTINNSDGFAIHIFEPAFSSPSPNNNVSNNTFINIETALGIETSTNSSTHLQQYLGNSTFTTLYYASTEGSINFTETVSFDTLTSVFVNITDNQIIVNSSAFPQLNVSANVTLYDIGNRGFAVPTILKDGVTCIDCHNFTALNASTVKFNVTEFSTYSIGDINHNLSSCQTITASGFYHINTTLTSQGTCLEIEASDVIIDGQKNNLTFGLGGGGYGVHVFNQTNVTLRNLLITTNETSNGKKGISFVDTAYSSVTNSSITVSGDNDISGIYTNNSMNNSFTYNYVRGTHYAILIERTSHDNLVEENDLHGGTVQAANTALRNNFTKNNITATNGNGFTVGTGADDTIILGNNISNFNSGGADGIQVNGAANVNITNNSIFSGTGAQLNSMEGIYVTSSSTNVIIESNNITMHFPLGGQSNVGIYLYNTGNDSIIRHNLITGGGEDNSYGVRFTGVGNITLYNNTLNNSATSDDFNYGLYMQSTQRSNITENTIHTGGDQSNIGVYVESNSPHNVLHNNTIIATGTTQYNRGLALEEAHNNTVTYNTITTQGTDDSDGFHLNNAQQNFFLNNNLSQVDVESQEIISLPNSTDNTFIYNTSFGELEWIDTTFLNNLTTNLTSGATLQRGGIIQLNNNSALLNASQILLGAMDSSMNVTLFDIGNRGFSTPTLLQNGVTCLDCTNFTALNASTVIFNVTEAGTYSIGEPNTVQQITNCQTLDSEGFTYNVTADINFTDTCFVFTADHVILEGNNNTLWGANTNKAINVSAVKNVTLRNFTILNSTGFYINQANDTLIEDIAFVNSTINTAATGVIHDSGTEGSVIRRNSFTDTQGSMALRLDNTKLASITHNTFVNVTGTSFNGAAFYAAGMLNSTFANNTLVSMQSSLPGSVYLTSSHYNVVANNTVNYTQATGNDGGFAKLNTAHNNTFSNNLVVEAIATSSGGFVSLSNADDGLFEHNIVEHTTASSGGFVSCSSSERTSFINNTVLNYSSGASVFSLSGCQDILLENNTITSSNATTAAYVLSGATANVSIRGEKIISTDNYAFSLESNGHNITNVTIEDASGGLLITSENYLNQTLQDLVLNHSLAIQASNEELNFSDTLNITGPVSLADAITISSNNVFVNTTLEPGLNVSAEILLTGLNLINSTPQVDFEDDGTFTSCSTCTTLFANGTQLEFNVTHFTSYKAAEGETISPNITITTPINNDTVAHTIVLRAEVADESNVSSVTYEIKNGTLHDALIDSGSMNNISAETFNASFLTNDTFPYGVNDSTHQNITFTVFATDTLGNVGNASTSWFVDNSQPGIQLITPNQAGEFIGENFTLDIAVSNHKLNYTTYNITSGGTLHQENETFLDAATFTWDDQVNISALGEGNYTLLSFANDSLSNNKTKQTWFYVDLNNPAITGNSWNPTTPANNTFTDVDDHSLNFTCTDTNLDTVWIDFNGTLNTSLGLDGSEYFWNLTNIDPGFYNYTGYCNDTAGKISSTEARELTIGEQYVTSCKTLGTDGLTYALQNDLFSNASCLTITASDSVLNCRGYEIVYGNTSVGEGIGMNGNDNVTIEHCVVNKNVTLGNSNKAISLTGVSNSTITNSTLRSHGANTNYAVYMLSNSRNNTIINSTLLANGSVGAMAFSLTDGLGIHVINSSITGAGSSSQARAVHISNSNYTFMSGNLISTAGGNDGATGIIATSGSTNNTFLSNTISTNSPGLRNDGASLEGSHNTFHFNQITTSGDYENKGVVAASSQSSYVNNTISTAGSKDNYGFSITGANNSFYNNSITTTGSNSEPLRLSGNNNTFTGNSLNLTSGFELNTVATDLDGTELIDQVIGNYSFSGVGGRITLENTSTGKVNFIDAVNASGDAFVGTSTSEIILGNNSVVINDSVNAELNASANITLFNMDAHSFSNPEVKKDGATCSDCTNFTSLTASTVVFNVTGAGTYSLGEAFTAVTSCQNISTAGSYGLTQDVSAGGTCFNITVSDVILDGDGYTIWHGNETGSTGINVSGGGTALRNVTLKDLNIHKGTNASGGFASDQNKGIVFTNIANSTIQNVTLSTNSSTGGSNYGIELLSSSSNTIEGANITTRGSNNNYGIRLSSSSYNILNDNIIHSNGNSNSNYGVEVLAGSDNNNITSNDIFPSGNSGSRGVHMQGANSRIEMNNINTTSTFGLAVGLHLEGDGHVVRNNTLFTHHTHVNGDRSYGIWLLDSNQIIGNNTITINASASAGIALEGTANTNVLIENTITTIGKASDGFAFIETGGGNKPSNNVLESNLLNAINQTSLSVQTSPSPFTLVDQTIGNYTLTSPGSVIVFNDTQFGSVLLLLNGSGDNLFGNDTSNIIIDNNSVTIASLAAQGVSNDANITLFNMDAFSFTDPAIKKGDEDCENCHNFTSLTVATIIFNVSESGTYSIGEAEGITSDPQNDSEWPMFMRSLNRTGLTPQSGPIIGSENLTTFSTSDTVNGLYSSPIVSSGFVYVGNLDGNLYQLNASNVSQQIAVTSGGTTFAVADGSLFTSSGGLLLELNASDITQQLSNSSFAGTPTISNGFLYSSGGSVIRQLNASDISQQIANFTTDGNVNPVTVGGDFVYATSNGALVYQLNASNVSELIASYNVSDGAGIQNIRSAPSVADGFVYTGSDNNKVYQLNASNVSQLIATYAAANDVRSTPAIGNGYVYVGSNSGVVHQLNATDISQQFSSYSTGSNVRSSAAVTSEYIYVGSYDGKIYQLNASNVSIEISNLSITTSDYSSPAISDDFVYIGGSSGRLRQLGHVAPAINLPSPNVSIKGPPSGTNYTTFNGSFPVLFEGNATINSSLVNLSLYLTNSTNESLALSNLSIVSGLENSSNFTLDLAVGNYTFQYEACDNNSECAFSENRSITVESGFFVDSCTVLDTAGTYFLTANVSSSNACFTLNTTGITLDGQGNTITLTGTEGINVSGVNNTLTNAHVLYSGTGAAVQLAATGQSVTNLTVEVLSTGVGITILENATVANNSIVVNGSSATGLEVRSTGGTITHNILNLTNTSSGAIQLIAASDVVVTNNTLTGVGSGLWINYGFGNDLANNTLNLTGTGLTVLNLSANNSVAQNTFTWSQHAFLFTGDNAPQENNLTNNTLVNISGFDLLYEAIGVNGTFLIDQVITNYSLNSTKLGVEDGFGRLVFADALAGSGTNFSDVVQLSNITIFVNSTTNPGLNHSANVTLFNVTFNRPIAQVDISDNGTFITCNSGTTPSCHNLSFAEEEFTFNVSHFTTYTAANDNNQSVSISYLVPTSASTVKKHDFFTITQNVTCDGSVDCGDVKVTLDPILQNGPGQESEEEQQ